MAQTSVSNLPDFWENMENSKNLTSLLKKCLIC
nr:MAG TPA: hypothetical protein [Caudoviricetes sp.]